MEDVFFIEDTLAPLDVFVVVYVRVEIKVSHEDGIFAWFEYLGDLLELISPAKSRVETFKVDSGEVERLIIDDAFSANTVSSHFRG